MKQAVTDFRIKLEKKWGDSLNAERAAIFTEMPNLGV
jgi:hypothetical protein